MVTQDAKKGFDELLGVSLVESLKTENYRDWEIKNKSNDPVSEKEIFMLTVSSYHFRVFVILHFTKNEKTMNYVADALKLSPEKLDDRRYYDFLGEIGNGFCGMYKRELGKYFPYLGMSTPNLMSGDTLGHLSVFDYEHESHWLAATPNEVDFYGSIFVSSYDEVDFKYELKSVDENVETGELEFF